MVHLRSCESVRTQNPDLFCVRAVAEPLFRRPYPHIRPLGRTVEAAADPCTTHPVGSLAGHLLQLLRRELRAVQSSPDAFYTGFRFHPGRRVPASPFLGLRVLESPER